MLKDLQAVILAGGRGTRLGSLGDKIPKAMVNINGLPFIELLIQQLKVNGIKKFLILTGYKKKQLIDYYKKNSEIF
ncbi:NTP transferase domain-containing protein, partial [Candidatus Pelagibacter bacterium]|nr:NTP transferase domain-containing protein [Candidatus Pelagibacter bacterium]